MATFTTASLRAAIARIAAHLEACADELNRLDGALGDGDLGVTMVRGARGLVEAAPKLPDDVGMAFLQCAQVFTKVSGSTYGTLLATGLMSAAKLAKGRAEIPTSEIADLLGAALEGMMKRGRGNLGDKTVLDALEAARAAAAGLDDPAALAVAVDDAVAGALERFRDQPAKQGRARIFGDKSIGLDDPGMVAFKRVVEALR
ncbi:MAG: dihydroxyacetone kinase subunit L [Chloroflexi bacterium]|nr:dihydroxyacetone kinase subunit L [Chloroflexota bacterium]